MSSDSPSGDPLIRSTSADVSGHRICVVGTSGAGKTYVAEALARILDIPYVCNDAIIWRPGWQATPRDEVYARVEEALGAEAWTFDGNLGASPEDQLALSRCDTLVWLDLPRWQVWSSMIRRTIGRAWTKEPLWHGNVESWRMMLSRDSIILWSLRSFARQRLRYGAIFRDPGYAGKTRVRVDSRRAVNEWLVALAASRNASAPTTGR